MKKMFQPAILTVITIILFGWAMITFYDVHGQFAKVLENPEPPWELTINFTPILIFFIVCTPIAIYLIKYGKNKHNSIKKAFLLPPELEEADEREQLITAKACRNSYITMWYIAPIAALLMSYYPFIQEQIPFYPIIIILVLPLSQIISYFYSLQKNL
ncbi:hypothetical protein [Bacillus weihaiensis]|uniref:DUF2178 domain-containing protein n=1 Tax=Bacillus weihaiensis TaxID=1547283 RepID=A0A1L3MPY6_9BACI|nr:hypothetical protein [Bacillus weihaiensis]APH04407.1 hypothetical protein A9C19_06405 [Bacillus weihaiensis]